MRTIDLTRLHGFVVGLELMAAITGRDDDVIVLCRSADQARLVDGAVERTRKKGSTQVNTTVIVKDELTNA